MLNHDLQQDEGILVLRPEGPLEAADFETLAAHVDAYLEQNGTLHPVQQAFLDESAMQCAYCTSGMIMSAVALLQQNMLPTEKEIVDFMDGNICRCGTYPRIVRAIQRAAQAQAPAVAKGAGR